MKQLLNKSNMKRRNNSLIKLLILMVIVFAVGAYIRHMQLKAVAEDWLDKQTKLIQEQNKVNQVQKELNKVKQENINLKKIVSLPIGQRVIAEIQKVFGRKASVALALSSCENNPYKEVYNPLARNYNTDGSFDVGPFQINSTHIKRFGVDFVTDWHENIKVAKILFDEQSVGPWYSSKNCWSNKIAQL